MTYLDRAERAADEARDRGMARPAITAATPTPQAAMPRVERTRFCGQRGGCDDPTCYFCQVMPTKFPQQVWKRRANGEKTLVPVAPPLPSEMDDMFGGGDE
jgi:hypothetical protein